MSTKRCRPAGIPLLCLALGAVATVSGCELLTEETCGTTRPSVHVDVNYVVWTASMFQPVTGCVLDISTTKQLCEGNTKGTMEFPDSRVNQNGLYEFTVGYNLTNSEDQIIFFAEASCPAASPSGPTRVNSARNTITYNEAAASGGTLRRHITINF